jgi:hypothetical protein
MEIFPKELLAQCYCIGCEEPSDIVWFRIVGTKYWITTYDDGSFGFSKDSNEHSKLHFWIISFEEFFEGATGDIKDMLIFNLNEFRPREEL